MTNPDPLEVWLDAVAAALLVDRECLALDHNHSDKAAAIIAQHYAPLVAEVERLRKALSRQTDNMAFVLNRVSLPVQWYEKFDSELTQDRATLTKLEKARAKKEQTEATLTEADFRQAFAGHGVAIRRADEAPIAGEPFMSMDIAARLAAELVESAHYGKVHTDGSRSGGQKPSGDGLVERLLADVIEQTSSSTADNATICREVAPHITQLESDNAKLEARCEKLMEAARIASYEMDATGPFLNMESRADFVRAAYQLRAALKED